MFLSEFSIKRPVAMIVIIIGLMAFGLLALSKLRVNQLPDVEQPVLLVNIHTPAPAPTRWSVKSSTASKNRCRAFRVSTSCVPPPAKATRRWC